jgi:hypothetical protein
MRRGYYLVIGLAVLGIALWGGRYSLRGAIGQWLYHEAKHSVPARPIEEVLRLGQKSLRLHPVNYRLCEYAAEAAYTRSFEPGVTNAVELKAAARFWCDRGLALNYYSPYLRWLKSQFLWSEDPGAAIANWAAYTEWQFWDAYNHAQLCEMYARVGRFPEAESEFKWVKGSVYEADVKKTIESEKKTRSEAAPPDPSPAG